MRFAPTIKIPLAAIFLYQLVVCLSAGSMRVVTCELVTCEGGCGTLLKTKGCAACSSIFLIEIMVGIGNRLNLKYISL